MMKAAVIGAGSTYTPELIEGVAQRRDSLPFDSVTLMDIDSKRLETLGGLAKRQLDKGGYKGKLELTGDISRALEGADFVFTQLRIGKMAARINDEKIPLKYGLLGQETTGVGGFMKALRTAPVIVGIAKEMMRVSSKGAWLINFSNPSGIVAEAVLNHTDVNMIGLCNCPINMIKSIADAIGSEDFDYEYVGLNHLSWITSVSLRGSSENLVPSLAGGKGGACVAAFRNIPGIEFDAALMRAVPYIPASYLSYYYARGQQIKKCADAEKTRGEICLELEKDLLEKYADPSLCDKPSELELRGGAMYSTAALSAVESIAGDKREKHVVAAKNNGAVPFMDDCDVVEVLCELGRDKVTPQPIHIYNDYVSGLMRAVKAYEKLTVRAALDGDRDAALAALMIHPLIGDYHVAAPVLEEMLEANREYLPAFFGGTHI